MHSLWAIAAASFSYVFLRAFQQLNVVHNAYRMVLITSYLMTAGDVFLIASYAKNGLSWDLWLVVGCSTGLGSCAAMWLRKRYTKQSVS